MYRNLKEEEILSLGIASFLHDVGMKNMSFVNKKEKLSLEEREIVKKHTKNVNINIFDIPSQIMKNVELIISQHHERINGKGYPLGLKKENIFPLSKILQVVDVYEAMTHYRPYRNPLIAHKAIKEIIDYANEYFDQEVVKDLIDILSLYPIGSYVKLNTNEIAQVIYANKGVPTKPIVKLCTDKKGKQINELKIIDLSSIPVIHIQECLPISKVSKFSEWWV
jgi:HD-GYP domain-containing protein (c-di-GMP phosphodiesterase class II)